MNNVLVTGANGQLAKQLKIVLPNAIFADITMLDITNLNAVLEFVKAYNIDIIINCAAYTAVDKAEDDEKLAQEVNANGAENLAKTDCKIIHISTDYVFDGKAYKPYNPYDKTNPICVYGKTKLAGEQAILQNSKQAIVIRTAWLYSIYGNNFVKTMRRLGSERESLNVVADQIGTPTFAGDLAQAIVEILPQINQNNKGIYHYTNEGVCSWYDFAVEIMSLSNLDCKVYPIASLAYPTKARRPFYSVLDKTTIKQTFNIKIPHWKESLKKCLKQF